MPLAATPGTMEANMPALLVIRGAADAVVSPTNAGAAALTLAQAACAPAGVPRQVQRGKRCPMPATNFKLHGDAVATLVVVAGLGHAWSGGATGQPDSDAPGAGCLPHGPSHCGAKVPRPSACCGCRPMIRGRHSRSSGLRAAEQLLRAAVGLRASRLRLPTFEHPKLQFGGSV